METTSNWISESELSLQDIIQECEKLPTGELVDILDEDKCISLLRPEDEKKEDSGCLIHLVSRPPSFISTNVLSAQNKRLLAGFTILSEARVLEVCIGTHEEYFQTVHGTLMGDFGDSKIFKGEVQFKKFQSNVTVKLKGTCHKDSVWLFGFFVTIGVDPNSTNFSPRNRFGSENLSSILREKDVQMSKEAMKFRQMLESYNSVKENNDTHGVNPMHLMSMFGTMLPMARSELSHSGPAEVNIKKNTKAEDEIESVFNKVELETKRAQGTVERNSDSIYKVENALKYLALHPENRTKESNSGTKRKFENGSESKLQMDKLFEKVHTYMEDKSEGPKSMMELTNILQKSVCVDPVLSFSHLPEISTIKPKMWNSNMQYANNRQDTRTLQGVDQSLSSTVEHRDSTNNVDFEPFMQRIEKIVDDKIAAMEERIIKTLEEKLAAKVSAESLRLDRIEGLLENICKKL